ncbi:tyrosine-type recombinase/integrase [Leptospira ilyithenensis]|uniref:tyrosine-type recombinase/integrase n=1 Tax=Leptospira ilyithenensis TaxID=2484901 RepID=UPI00319D8B39
MDSILELKYSPEDSRYILYFPYRAEWVRLAKSIPGRKYDWNRNIWSFPQDPVTFKIILKTFYDTPIRFNIKEIPRSVKILADLHQAMRARNYSFQTARTYYHWIIQICFHFRKLPYQITKDEIIEFTDYCTEVKSLSSASIRSMRQAFLFYFKVVRCQFPDLSFPRMKKENTLPEVLSESEVKKILNAPANPKHKLLLKLAYSAGLRVSEAVHLKISDIDFDRKMIRIEQAKGKKDRYTLLADSLCEELREYLLYRKKVLQFGPVSTAQRSPAIKNEWLFPGHGFTQLSIRSAEKIFETSKQKLGITKKVSFHSLRHAFATHLLEQGTDLRMIQTLLGHMSVRTTQIYAKVSRTQLTKIRSPFDRIS